MESSRRDISSVQEGSQRVSQNLTLRSSFIKKNYQRNEGEGGAGEIVRMKAVRTIISPSCSYSRKTHCLCLSQ